MNILGIHDGHNATLALFRNDKIVYAVSEERLSRIKNQGGFPHLALARILAETQLTTAAIDKVIFTTNNTHAAEWFDREKLLLRYRKTIDIDVLQRPLGKRLRKSILSPFRELVPWSKNVRQAKKEERFKPLLAHGFLLHQIGTMDHHLAHAASAYFAHHDFDHDVLVLTNDGGGDGLCASVSIGREGRLDRLATVSVRNSFAALYARATFLMGMMPLEHEYKLMGLAPYADQKKARFIADTLLSYFEWPSEAPLTWRLSDRFISVNYLGAHLKQLFFLQRFDVIAATMQQFVEDVALQWIRNCIAETKIRHLALAGGLFMNVKLNQKILAFPEVDSLYVMPSAGDESTPIGACYWGATQEGVSPKTFEPLCDLYLGPTYDNHAIDEAVRALAKNGVEIQTPESIEDSVAELF